MENFKMITTFFTRWKWPNYRDMAGRYLMPHKYYLALHFWCDGFGSWWHSQLVFFSIEVFLLITIGPMPSYVGLYQETLVWKIERRNDCWVNPGFWPGKFMTAKGIPQIYPGWGCPGQRGPKSFFPPNNEMEYSMKIGGKLLFGQNKRCTTGPMTLYVGLYQDRAWYDWPTNYSPKTTRVGLFNSYLGFCRCLTSLTYS
jgi:hypothetical protein